MTTARLIAEEGAQKGLVLTLDEGDEWVVGRDPDLSQFVLLDPSISRKHAILRQTDEGILLENLSSTNPTDVNGISVNEPILLKQGDAIQFGNELFRVYLNNETQITENNEVYDTIFEEDSSLRESKNEFSNVEFDLNGAGRWILKVVSGPNNGAEYHMHPDATYTIGTEPNTCDIIFHDNSVSRQHARLTIDENDQVTIEDLNSKNGTLVDGNKIDSSQSLKTNTLVSLGTTTFLVFDKEGEMQTIVSPILPSVYKALQTQEEKTEEKKEDEEASIVPPSQAVQDAARQALKEQVIKPERKAKQINYGLIAITSVIAGIFLIAGIGTTMLFKSEPILEKKELNPEIALKEAFAPFPDIRYTFNKNTGQLLLLGHVLSPSDKSQLLYNLQGLKFIRNIDDSGVIIDEYIWQNYNQILSKHPNWRGITLHSPKPGKFVLTGYLKTRAEAEALYDYLNSHFGYLDRLEKEIVIEEDVINTISIELRNKGFSEVNVEMNNNVVTLTGSIPPEKGQDFNTLLTHIKKNMPEVRNIKTFVQELSPEKSVVNISDSYQVSGISKIGKTLNVVINGRILTKGDSLDGMRITNISNNTIWLEKDSVKYRIDY